MHHAFSKCACNSSPHKFPPYEEVGDVKRRR
uniref:Uncharacterized protein n=1 Tax=Arundo donax TaxID=35708 RepID=A0A0A9GVV7_ARUDO